MGFHPLCDFQQFLRHPRSLSQRRRGLGGRDRPGTAVTD